MRILLLCLLIAGILSAFATSTGAATYTYSLAEDFSYMDVRAANTVSATPYAPRDRMPC
jgi:hypothetical protein